MGKVVCIANQKGGVGKTTTTNALAVILKSRGYSVLCIDFDPQGNLSFSMDADTLEHPSIYHVLRRETKARFAIQHTALCDIIPSDMFLSGIEPEFTGSGREFLLFDVLKPVMKFYDFILIDAPPELGVLTVNAFTAADCIVVPMVSDIYSLQGIVRLYETVDRVREYLNPRLHFAGLLLVRYNPREEVSRTVLKTAERISADFDIPLFETYIHYSAMLSKAQMNQENILECAPKNQAVADYNAFTDELLAGEGIIPAPSQKGVT